MKFFFALVLAAALAGCATRPPSIVQQPMTARPPVVVAAVPADGAIYHAQVYRPLFEDLRARHVGDTLSILINEKTSAGKQAATSSSKSGALNLGVPKLFGIPSSTTDGFGLSTKSAGSYDDKGAATASNTFVSVIGVTVTDVLANGNLVVSGEKQIALDKNTEYVRFSGVVRPDTIGAGNVVSSTQVADARVEYRTDSAVDAAQVMSSLSRFFFSVLPF